MKFKDWYKNKTVEEKNKLIDEISKLAINIYIKNQCQKCGRLLPNKSFYTKNGCKWCDSKWHLKRLRKQKLVHKPCQSLC